MPDLLKSASCLTILTLRLLLCRRVFFEDLLNKAKEKHTKEEKRVKLIAEDFTDLLRSRHVKHDSAWDDIKSQIDHKERFKAVRPCSYCSSAGVKGSPAPLSICICTSQAPSELSCDSELSFGHSIMTVGGDKRLNTLQSRT